MSAGSGAGLAVPGGTCYNPVAPRPGKTLSNMTILRRFGLGLLAGAVFLAPAGGCKPPKYVRYSSPFGDYAVDVPWGWSVFMDSSGWDYTNVTFTGPLEPEFYKGLPSLSIRWYATRVPHRLPDGNYESYQSAEDYTRQMLRDVYGPDAVTHAGADKEARAELNKNAILPPFKRVKMSNWGGTFYVVWRSMPAPEGEVMGVTASAQDGRKAVIQRHAYAVLPMDNGFYVLTYPATRDGYEKWVAAFNQMVNSFRVVKDGPNGPAIDYSKNPS